MVRLARTCSLAALAIGCTVLPAQQRGMYGGISTGRIVGSITDPGFAGRLGATVSGLPQTSGQAIQGMYGRPGGGPRGFGGFSGYGRQPRTVVVPWGIPVVYGGGGYGYGSGYGPELPQQTIVQQVQPSPSVIINQYYTPEVANPQMREYNDLPEPPKPPEPKEGAVRVYPPPARSPAPPAPAAAERERRVQDHDKATITLLAFNDSSVVATIGYWLQGDTLHYITNGFAKKTVPASTLDRGLSEQLNRERKVEFKLE